MSGYVIALSACGGCRGVFPYNPTKVPSLRDGAGVQWPICPACFECRQKYREAHGLEREPLEKDAYGPCPEGDL